MSSNQRPLERPTVNDGKTKFYVQDDENTFMYKPIDHNSNKFFGTFSRVANMEVMLNNEAQNQKMPYQAYFKAKVELMSVPQCFDRCVRDVTMGGLSSDEKNCVRECAMKKISSRDDLAMLASQKLARDTVKSRRDTFV